MCRRQGLKNHKSENRTGIDEVVSRRAIGNVTIGSMENLHHLPMTCLKGDTANCCRNKVCAINGAINLSIITLCLISSFVQVLDNKKDKRGIWSKRNVSESRSSRAHYKMRKENESPCAGPPVTGLLLRALRVEWILIYAGPTRAT